MLSDRQLRRREGGASLVELSLVLFILLLLVAGVIDFGRAFNSYIVINNASREGARYASRLMPLPSAEMSVFQAYETRVLDAVKQETAGSSVDLDDEDIDIDPNPVGDDDGESDEDGTVAISGEPITVTVSYEVPTIIASIAGSGFGSLSLRAQTTMVIFGQNG